MNKYQLSGYLIGLPIFIGLTPSGFTLPESYYQMDGVPLHSSMLALILLSPAYRFTWFHLSFVALFFAYVLVCCLHEASRALLAFQSFYFIIYYYVLRSLTQDRLNLIALSAAKAILFFVVAHLVSILVTSFGSFLNIILVGTGYFWGMVLYQSHLTYPIVMIFGLMLSQLFKSGVLRYEIIFLVVVLIIEILLLRRVGLALLVVYTLLYRPKLSMFIFIPFLGLIFAMQTEVFSPVVERFVFGRANAWSDSVDILSNPHWLFFGNGLNNYSHNFFMHTVTTHGLLYGIVLFCVLIKILFMSARACQFAIAPCCFISVLILIDWNVNANLYQPYYAAMFALLLNSISSRNFNFQYNKAEIS